MRNGRILETNTYPNQEPSERRLLDLLLETLRARLPMTWELTLESVGASRGQRQSDNRLIISAPDGGRGVVDIEVKLKRFITSLDVAALQRVKLPAANASSARLVLAPYLSPRARTLLTESRLNYADATGNLLLRLDQPALYIEGIGAQENPWYEQQPLRSLKGRTAGRAVRAICDFRPPLGIRELAEKTKTSVSVISRVARLLEQEALLERTDRGAIRAVSVAQVIKRWVQDYSLIRSNRIETCLEPRGLEAFIEKMRAAEGDYTLTGSLAAVQVAPFATPRLAAVYVNDIERAKGDLRVRAVDRGANLLLIEPFDPVVFERTTHTGGLAYAAPTQVAADLLTSPGRSPEEGEELLRWMEEHRDDWQWR